MPGVGENLQDHLQLRTIFSVIGARTLNVDFQSLLRKRAWMGARLCAGAARADDHGALAARHLRQDPRPTYATANVEFHVQPLSLERFGEPLHAFPAITLSVCNLRPASRGSVACAERRSARRADDPAELSLDRGGPSRRRRFDPPRPPHRRRAGARALSRREEFRPGAAAQSEAELAQAAGDIGTTIFHPVGTAKMGRDDDRDARSSTRGCACAGSRGLRIADASVMPRITSGNTNSPTLMIAEKAAAMILADAARR